MFSLFLTILPRNDKISLLEDTGKYAYTLYIAHFPIFLVFYFLINKFMPSALVFGYGWVLLITITPITIYLCKTMAIYLEDTRLIKKNMAKVSKIIGFKRTTSLALMSLTLMSYANANTYKMLKTNQGLQFGMIQNKTDAPLVIILTTSIHASLTDEYSRFSKTLSEYGFNIVSIDIPCHGLDKKKKEQENLSCWRTRLENGELSLFDTFSKKISHLINYLRHNKLSTSKEIITLGVSRGGYLSFDAAISDKRITHVITLSPVTNLFTLSEFANSHLKQERFSLIKKSIYLTDKSIFIQIGNNDSRVGTKDTLDLIQRISNRRQKTDVTCLLTPEAGHLVMDQDVALNWIKNKIKPNGDRVKYQAP